VRLLRDNNARIAMDTLVRTLYQKQNLRGHTSFSSEDSTRKQLDQAVEEYSNVLFQLEEEVRKVTEGEAIPGRALMACCPSCSGTTEEGICRPQLYGDGYFKVTHLRKAGTATLHDPPLQHRFPDDAKVAEFCQSRVVSRAKGSAETKECNDFDADMQLGRTSEKYDFTGIFGIFCRHGMLICALNMVTGEKWSYATYLLYLLMLNNVVPSVLWYDINCRYKSHFKKWLPNSDLPEDIKQLAGAMRFPLPVFHHYMHNAPCQASNSFRSMEEVGCGAGEPPEAAWSHLGPYGYLLQYMSRPARQAALEKIAANWNAAKLATLPDLLVRMYTRAAVKVDESLLSMAELCSYARLHTT
jgi:hypothetical protein